MSIPIGYAAKLSEGGVATLLTAEACSAIADDAAGHHRYQITNAAKRVLDPNTAMVPKENGSASSAANIYAVDAIAGIIIFATGHSPATPVTMDGKYIPRAVVANIDEVSSSPKLNMVEKTPINSAGYVQRAPTTLDWDGDFKLLEVLHTQGFDALLTGTAPTRGWALLSNSSGDLKPKEIVTSQVKFTLYDQSAVATALSGFQVNAAVSFFTA